MLNKRIINTGGGAACTTDTTQILNAGSTQSLALYRFEDNANDTASGTGKFGKGAVFNGSNSEITLPAALSDGSTTDTNCISFWFNVGAEVTSSSSNNEIMMFSKSGSNDGKIALGSTTGNFSNETFSVTSDVANQYTYITETIPAGWNHAVVQWNSSTTKWDIYLNGQAKSTSTFGTNEQGKLFLNFGKRSSYYYDGKLDQVRVFNKSLSSSEVTTLYNETSSTVDTLQILGDTSCIATYRFEGNAQDLSGNYYHGSASNVIYDYSGTASNVTYVTGKFGKAVSFNGTDASIDIESKSLIQNDIKSFSFWFKSKFIFGFYDPSSASSSDRRRWFIDNTTNGSIKIQVNNDQYNYEQTGITEDSNWHHLAVIDNGSIYLDGNLLSNTFNTSYWITNGTNGTSRDTIRIGSGDYIGSASVSFVEGLMDQIRFFNKTLTAPEINSLYTETATSAALGTIDNPSTLAYYKMADATDETGNYDGTPTGVNFNVEGKYGFAGKFIGSNKIVIPSDLGLRDSNVPLTFSLWINFDNIPANGTFRAIAGSESGNTSRGPFAINMYGTSSGAVTASFERYYSGLMYYTNSPVTYYTNAALYTYTPGVWYHLCFVYTPVGDGTSTVSVYINGSQSGITNPTYTLDYGQNRASANNLVIGVYSSSSPSGWKGKLDQIRIFNRAISASEVTTLYNEVQCANTITAPENYFNTKLYVGTGSSSNTDFTGVGFDPNFIWIKNRDSSGENHAAADTVRGQGYILYPNLNLAKSGTNYITAITDGFRINTGNNNVSGNNYVSWNWKAGSSNVTNNDGTLTSTVSASQESGFSIVKYAGNGTAGSTVGHGLGVVPSLIIWKNIDATSNWLVYSPLIGNDSQWLYLNLDSSSQSSGSTNEYPTNKVAPTSSVVTVNGSGSSNNINISGQDTIMYCFANIDGYQRIGSYVGTGTPENFIYTGFEAAWVLIKNISTGSTNWVIVDNKRDNGDEWLYANTSAAYYDDSNTYTKFYANGFSVANNGSYVNTSGDTYLFLAIAANPDTTAPTKANSFNIKLYTGNDSNDRDITGLGFKPDFLWIKRRSSEPHALYDSIRGPNLQLTTHNTDAEATNSGSYLGMSSFDADGFNVGNNGGTNRAPHDYVAWAWKGLDHDRNLPQINNQGSITSLVSANIAAGFSIVSYKGTASFGATVGHGLGSELDYLIVKARNDINQAWNVYVKGVTDTNAKYFRLNENNGIYTTTNPRFVPGNFSDDVFSIGSDNACNGDGDDYIAYCFRSISGYSKVGTYSSTGATGSSNQITTGFQPRFLLVKASSHSEDWYLFDSERLNLSGGTNDGLLFGNTSGAENTGYDRITFSSTGFYWNTAYGGNSDGYTYFYLAIA